MDFVFLDNYYIKGGKLYGYICTQELRMAEYVEERQKGLSWTEIFKRDDKFIKDTTIRKYLPDGTFEDIRKPPREFSEWLEYCDFYYDKDGELFLKRKKYAQKPVILVKPDSFFAT
jgi:hypothetical protein